MLKSAKRAAYFFTVPTVLFFIIIYYIPMVYAGIMSFCRWSVITPAEFIGLGNYINIFSGSTVFKESLANTFVFCIEYVILLLISSLLIAVFMYGLGKRLLKGMTIICYLPVIAPMVGMAIVWKWIYNSSYGLANQVLGLIGLGPYPWIASAKMAMISIVIFSVWKIMGMYIIIFLVGLQNIPDDYYEAARIDGASKFQLFKYITIPSIMPIILFVVVIGTIHGLRAFSQIYIMTGGGPGRATKVVSILIYENAFRLYQMGKASAIAIIMMVIILVLTFIQMRFLSTEDH